MRVWNAKDVGKSQPGMIYVGRPSKWGNPFIIGQDGDRAEVVAKYREYLEQHPSLYGRLDELVDYDLVCWCYPEPCHADVLIELIQERYG